ncbi:MAG: hypothetical protein AAF138_05125 [Planctomycetota bacterium]
MRPDRTEPTPAADTRPSQPNQRTPLIRWDLGWLLLPPGLALLGAVMLAPAWSELAETRRARDAELAREQWTRDRLERYEAFVAAYDAGDPDLMDRLRIAQLNTLPDGRSPLPGLEPGSYAATEPALGPDGLPAADVFAWLEPPPPETSQSLGATEPDAGSKGSLAERWADSVAGLGPRLWLIGLGGGLTFAGLLIGLRTEPERHGEPGDIGDDDATPGGRALPAR